DLIFVVDTSGSMAGKKLEQLKKALLFCLDNLASQDRFNLIRLSTEAEALWPSLQTVSKTSVEKTRQMVEDFKAIGGTNIEAALSLALKEKQDQTRPCLIVFLTDGRPTVGETDTGRIIDKLKQANTGNRRIFTFGIGHDVNTHLLDRITELTRADRVYIHPEEDLEIKVSAFYEKISFPVLTDLQLDFGALGVSALYPAPLPDLFRGSQLMLLGRYRGAGKTLVRLTGQMEKERKEFTASFDFPAENRDNDFLPALWAAQHIGYLLDQMRLHGENSELKDEVVRLARKYGIITPYTSYLIVEDEKVRIAEGRLRREEATLSAIPMADRTLEKRMAADYQGLGQVTGAGSVRASQEVQALKQATSFSHVSQGKERLAYVDSDGQMKNLAQQVKYVGGRAFYQVENAWVDSLLPLAKNLPVRKIQFASAEYFQLLKQQPEVNRILALGKTVSFVFQNQIYQISE
ncbi:MAG TPA: VWA domain-containing protein, partial [bacterium]|nr:VWA domain-containing protein [bacterium]